MINRLKNYIDNSRRPIHCIGINPIDYKTMRAHEGFDRIDQTFYGVPVAINNSLSIGNAEVR